MRGGPGPARPAVPGRLRCASPARPGNSHAESAKASFPWTQDKDGVVHSRLPLANQRIFPRSFVCNLGALCLVGPTGPTVVCLEQ